MNAVKFKWRNYKLPIPETKLEIILFLQMDNKEIKQLSTLILQLWRNAEHKLQLTQHGKDILNSSITMKNKMSSLSKNSHQMKSLETEYLTRKI